MIEQIFQKRPKRHIKDLNIVPILDMLTTVIFFLLMSTSFIEYTKLTVPPSQVSVSSSPVKDPPVTPKMLLAGSEANLKVLLTWGGRKAGEAIELINEPDPALRREALLKATQKLSQNFILAHPDEKTLQLALTSKLPYQDLISMMDGVRESLPDIVLISPAEAEARNRFSNGGPKK
ncbi:MAG: biopolymer transporter ExbD [Oligoflexia bacterium]|nr:biopolymer transporter ExbD [Oligoflexia bacterium]